VLAPIFRDPQTMLELKQPAPGANPGATLERPASATVSWINFTGLLGLFLSFPVARWLDLGLVPAMLLSLASIAVPIILCEVLVKHVGLVGAPARRALDAQRVCLKLLGLWTTMIVIGVAYWLFPYYRGGAVFPFLVVALDPRVWLPVILLAPFYIAYVDRRMAEPEDGYLMVGLIVVRRGSEVDRSVLREHVLGWLVKAFFLPFMMGLLVRNTNWLLHLDPATVLTSYESSAQFLISFAYAVDVAFGSLGYFLTLKLFDSHIRTTEPTLLGWTVALACYPPFLDGVTFAAFLAYGGDQNAWRQHFADVPLLGSLWAAAALFLVVVYAWATVQFGIRFSNLTHRGIITEGPFRWTKHPAYITKNISWWMLSVPFLSAAGPAEALRTSILLLGVNMIYFLRAKTEERHLSWDPDYRAYAQWMDQHGLFAILKRRLRGLASWQPRPGEASS